MIDDNVSKQDLPEELIQYQNMLMRFVEEEIEPQAQAIETANDIPDALLIKAGELGLFGMSIPEEFGGMGVSELASSVAVEALSHGPGGATFYIAPSAPAAAIRLAGNDEQRQRFLPNLASGKEFAAFCLSESGAGSDAAGIKTRAERRGDKWIINGSKIWISRARRASVFLVSAVTDPSKRGSGAITVFVLEKRQGVLVGKADRQIGLSGSGSAEVTFQDVEVGEADVLGKVGGGFEVLKFILGRARLWAAARATGICSRALKVS